MKIGEKSPPYERKGTGRSGSDLVPIPAAGIGTRISEAARQLGVRKNAAEAIGISNAALQRYVSEENTPPVDVVARLCAMAGVRLEWLVYARDPMLESDLGKTAPESHSQPVRLEELTVAVQLVEEVLEGKALPPAKRAELVALVYEGLVEGLPEATVLRWARTAAK